MPGSQRRRISVHCRLQKRAESVTCGQIRRRFEFATVDRNSFSQGGFGLKDIVFNGILAAFFDAVASLTSGKYNWYKLLIINGVNSIS